MPEERTFKVGLVGAGHICEFHVRALRRIPGVLIVGVTDLDPARAQILADRLQLPATFPSLDAMVAAGANVIHVLTPPSSHAQVAIRALELGCHVLVEKPLAMSAEDCDRVAEAARTKGLTVGVNHSLLADPFVARALELVQRGVVGEVRSCDYFRNLAQQPYAGGPLPAQCREGGFPFRDIGVHGLYLIEAFLGDIESVQSHFANAEGATPFYFSEWRTVLLCRRGTGQIQLSWTARPQQSVLIVQGTEGVLRADLFGMVLTTRRNRKLPEFVRRLVNTWSEGMQTCLQVQGNGIRVLLKRIRQYHGVQDFVAAFYAALASGRPAPVTPEQARPIVYWTEHVARLADAALEKKRFASAGPFTAKVLVTGGTGFVGGHLLRKLAMTQEKVRVLTRRPPSPELASYSQFEWVLGDLGDPEAVDRAVAGTEVVYHIGAAMKGREADFLGGTLQGTRNVVESALRHNARIVYVSSLSVLRTDTIVPGISVDEDWPLEPHPERRGWYSRAKLEAERVITDAVRQHGLRALILRPGQVIGPGSSLITPAIGLKAKKWFVVIGDGTRTVPLVHVDDLVETMLRGAQSDIWDGSVFHLVDPMQVTQNEMIRYAKERPNAIGRVVHIPSWVVLGVARVVGGLMSVIRRRPMTFAYRLKSAAPVNSFDCTRARSKLHWNPSIGVAAGLAPASSK
jgi:predicted dehydrogenase/nucleoside-diphosphate-sugar epimerase